MPSAKCTQCGLVNFADATNCKRCGAALPNTNLQPAPPGSVVTEDGYVLPPPPSPAFYPSGPGIWRDKSTLVMDKNAVLPDRCVKCNESARGVRLKRKLSWHHPILYLLILGAALFYLIVAMVVRKTAKFEIGICERHLQKRRQAILITWVLIIGSIVAFFVAVAWDTGALALLGVLLFFVGLIYGLTAARIVAPAKIDDRYVWLRGVNKDYLNQFPTWPGY